MSWIGAKKDSNPYDLIPNIIIKQVRNPHTTYDALIAWTKKYMDWSIILNISIEDSCLKFSPFWMINEYIKKQIPQIEKSHEDEWTDIRSSPFKLCIPGTYDDVYIID